MGKFALELKATLENIEELKTSGEDFSWWLKFTCSNCGEVTPKFNDVSLTEEFSDEHGKSVIHFIYKCKMCLRSNNAAIIRDSIKPYGSNDDGKFKMIVVFDCRGMEPTNFSPRDGWIAKATENGDTFTEVDLTDGDWADYCDKTKKPVSVSEVDHRFVKTK